MKNINKNAVQAISLDGKVYLAHKSVENFSLGAGDFTVEVLFICNSITDCCFYTQEQGFEFGIKGRCLYFELEGVGSIKQSEEIALETDALYFAAVSCKDGALSLYFEGFPVAGITEVKSVSAENTGNYFIGKGLDGYIVELRLRSCGMTDQEILQDCGMGLRDCDSIEFWTDFTAVQYKDKSSNALPLWTNEGIVVGVNASSCTQLASNGGFATITKQSYTSGYTLLFKIFPRLENNNIMYIYSVVSSEGQTVFSVGLQSDDGGYKHIFVEHNGASYLGESTLPLAQWVDVALRIESTEARVYIDGTDEMSFPFSGELTNISAMIGVKPFKKKVSFKNSFDGYLDYFAEFECALEPDKIDFYAEEQPYIFDDSIRTLYAFYCGEPIDLASGGAMYKVGQSKAMFVKNLNDLNAPIGMDFRVPQEVCAEWQELDEYEQWAMTTAMDMVREIYSQSLGYTIPEGIVPIEQAATRRIKQLFEEEIHESKIVWPPEEEEEIIKNYTAEAIMKAVGGIGIAVVCCAAIAAVAATATAAANGAVMGGKAVIAVESVMIISEVCAILVVTLAKIENDSKKKKPKDKNGWVDLISVCCNHNGNPQNGSIHFHSDAALTGPENMVYVNTGDFSIDMLLVTNAIENLCVNCILTNTTNKSVTGVFGLKCQVFNAFVEQVITILPYGSINVSLYIQLKNKEYNALAKYLQDGWQFFFDDVVMCYCTANVYLQKDLPIEPWKAHIGEPYDRNIKEYPSLYFIRKMILVPQNRQETDSNKIGVPLNGEVQNYFNNLLDRLYNSGTLIYNYITKFTNNFCRFQLLRFLETIFYEGIVEVNCTDCANIVSLIAAELGIEMGMNLIFGVKDFTCNQIMSMPRDIWHDQAFRYHQVAFYSEGDNFSNRAEIYDLSLKIDLGMWPSLEEVNNQNYVKRAALSGGLRAYETVGYLIDIIEPYDESYYLERLVRNGELASFQDSTVHTVIWDNEALQAHNELYTKLIQHYINSYGLNDKKYADEIPQLTVQPLFLQKVGLEIKWENQYECEWSAPGGMRVTWFRNAEHLSAGEYLASVLTRFSCCLTEKEVAELGERVFYGPDLLITYFEGSAYLIECKDMEKAEEMTRNLKSSMIQ